MADREQGFKSDLVIQFVLSGRGTQGHQKIDKRIIKNFAFCYNIHLNQKSCKLKFLLRKPLIFQAFTS